MQRHASNLFLALLLAGCALPGTPAAIAGATHTAARQIPVGASPHGMAAAGGFVYNANTGDGTVSVIDAATDAVVKTLPFEGGTPGYLKSTHDATHLLALDTKRELLLVIDPAQDHHVLQTVPLGHGPDKLLVSEDDRRVLVSLAGEPKALSLEFGEGLGAPPTRREFAVGTVAGEGGHRHRAMGYAHGWVVVPSSGENHVQLIDCEAATVMTVEDGNEPAAVAIGPADGKAGVAIVGNKASHTVTLYDLPSGEKTTLAGVGLSPTDIAVDAALGRAFVTMAGSNEVAAIDYRGKKFLGKLPVGRRPVHVYHAPALPEGAAHELWVGNDDGGTVSVIDGEALRVIATVATGEGHHKMAFAGRKAYVSNIKDATVSVVDRTTLR